MVHPIANHKIISLFEQTNCVGENTGWIPNHFKKEQSLLPSFIKLHSYGEYIFDWEWANFYEHNKIDYYPKLLHAIPFNPVNAPKFLGDESHHNDLAKESFDFYQKHNLSSEHYLFINNNEQDILESLGFTTQLSHQYHFQNKYESFEHFLDLLKKNKRKNIKKERKSILESGLQIETLTDKGITGDLLELFYSFYLSTIAKKRSYAYLTKEFFKALKDQSIIIKTAKENDKVIAMALFFYSDDTLYGRNWGILPEYEQVYPFLHFELCYYQGIEYCIKNSLKLFEAGAQGEHKLTRGFEPVIIKSAHHIKIPQCYEIIKKDISNRNNHTLQNIKALKSYLPFKDF